LGGIQERIRKFENLGKEPFIIQLQNKNELETIQSDRESIERNRGFTFPRILTYWKISPTTPFFYKCTFSKIASGMNPAFSQHTHRLTIEVICLRSKRWTSILKNMDWGIKLHP
jgi:hypothetical protein